MESEERDIMGLIACAPWREAVTYRETWPHEYVVIQKDNQQELLAEFCRRLLRGEGVAGRFFHQTRSYLFLGDYKYWVMDEFEDIDPESYDSVLNRALLFKDRRDFVIQRGDNANRKEASAMATQPLGRIGEVPIKQIWPDEARNFTVWLSEPENLQLLGDALELNLELVKREAPVGRYRLDILAREKEFGGRNVAIENQIGWSDHGHLGQLLTYSAGHGAGVVVWIAREFTDEHRAAIEWLNQCTTGHFEFYAVEIHAVRIGDSIPAPEFRVMAFPSGWPKEKQHTPIASSPENDRYRTFHQPMMEDLQELGFTSEIEAEAERYLDLISGLEIEGYEECVYYGVCLDDWYGIQAAEAYGKAWIYLWFRGGRGFVNQTFEVMKEQMVEIETEFGAELDWWRIDRRWNIAAVRIGMDCSIDDPQEKHDETRTWMLETLPRLREVLNPRLERILAEMEEA